jgi:hypothetical protein
VSRGIDVTGLTDAVESSLRSGGIYYPDGRDRPIGYEGNVYEFTCSTNAPRSKTIFYSAQTLKTLQSHLYELAEENSISRRRWRRKLELEDRKRDGARGDQVRLAIEHLYTQ